MGVASADQDLRYPIGEFDKNAASTIEDRVTNIGTIADLPAAIGTAIRGLNDEQLDTRYRPGGWTVRQTVHHIADSHTNSLTRFKLALTEDTTPTIKPYFEDRWAELGDSELNLGPSLDIISGVHARWTALLNSMTEDQFAKTFIHPETGEWSLEQALALYAWHSRHHTAHITHLKRRLGW